MGISATEKRFTCVKIPAAIILLLILIPLSCTEAEAQSRRTFSGVLLDAETERPVTRAKVRSGRYSDRTDAFGRFSFDIVRGEQLTATHADYHDRRLLYRDFRRTDSMTIYMSPSSARTSNIYTAPKSETVYQKDFENVLDYAFLGDTLVLLNFMEFKPRTSRYREAYLNNTLNFNLYGEDFKRITLPHHVTGLYHDPAGGLWVIGVNFVLEVIRERDEIYTRNVSGEFYEETVKKLAAVMPGSRFFSEMLPLIPQVTYRVYLESTQDIYPVRYIRNDEYFKNAPGDYRMLTDAQRRQAEELEEEYKIDRIFFAPYVRSKNDRGHNAEWRRGSFQPNPGEYKRPETQAFGVDRTLVIFDVLNSRIYYHDSLGFPTDSLYMYHHNFDGERYRGMIQDRYTGKCYALHNKGGAAFIREIHVNTGGAGKPMKLRNSFPENIRIHNGYVYYTYREPNSREFRKLLRERLR